MCSDYRETEEVAHALYTLNCFGGGVLIFHCRPIATNEKETRSYMPSKPFEIQVCFWNAHACTFSSRYIHGTEVRMLSSVVFQLNRQKWVLFLHVPLTSGALVNIQPARDLEIIIWTWFALFVHHLNGMCIQSTVYNIKLYFWLVWLWLLYQVWAITWLSFPFLHFRSGNNKGVETQ